MQPRTTLRSIPLALCLAAPTLLLAGASAQEDRRSTEERIAGARSTLERWVDTRRLISKEKRDWTLGREALQSRIDLVAGEIEGLQKRLADTRASLGDADTKRGELTREKERLQQASAGLGTTIARLEERTRALLARLPDPIRERVRPLSQRLPEDAATTKLPLSERFQNVVGILNEVDKFAREITVTSEVRTLADGTSAEVTALYVGLGQGYYVTANQRHAGIGTATESGWTWTSADDVAPAIARATRILANEEVAGFVRLPLEVR
jgi:hypothetical protein